MHAHADGVVRRAPDEIDDCERNQGLPSGRADAVHGAGTLPGRAVHSAAGARHSQKRPGKTARRRLRPAITVQVLGTLPAAASAYTVGTTVGRSPDEISDCHAGGARLRIVRRRVLLCFFDRSISVIINRCRCADDVDAGFRSVHRLTVRGDIELQLVLFFGHSLLHSAGVLAATCPILELAALRGRRDSTTRRDRLRYRERRQRARRGRRGTRDDRRAESLDVPAQLGRAE